MDRTTVLRYGDVAVLFHWLIALFIIGLLGVGKYMVTLDENDPVRFALTQWHKSFGLTVLLLSALRLIWRFIHRPPPDPATLPLVQKRVAHGVHWLLYCLMFALPVSGWILVSASPLNIDTVLFDVVTIPHLPPFDQLDNRAQVAHWFEDIHEIAGNLLILLLLAHIGAALKHHLIDKDTILLRMLPARSSRSFRVKAATLGAALTAATGGIYLSANSDHQAALLSAGASEVSFTAEVTGESAVGFFTQSEVTALLDESSPEQSSIVATVQTASVSSDNSQLESTLPDAEWFNSGTYPAAQFDSTTISSNADGTLQVTGILQIKNIENEVSFPMTISIEDDTQVARGEFTIDRTLFDIGMESQATEDFVAHDVTVKFRFNVSAPDG